MLEILTLDEMKTRYPDEWVLVEDPELDEQLNVIRGRVLWHSKSREEIDQKDQELAPHEAAVVFTGGAPKGMVFAL